MLRLAIVDDHDLFRAGLKMILEKHTDISVVAEGVNGEDAIQIVRKQKPDVLLLDISMPVLSGVEAMRRIGELPGLRTKVIIVTVHADTAYPRRLLDAGASGYLTKTCAAPELLAAIYAVAAGRKYIEPAIAQLLALSMLPGGNRSPFDDLSPREAEVAIMFAQGERAVAIAQRLNLSVKTVSTYKYRIFAKLDVKNDVELARLALAHGLVMQVREKDDI
jgi:two-component system, NarL family, invasion response regulator UvrY